MNWKVLPLPGGQVCVIIREGHDDVYTFSQGDPFVYGLSETIEIAASIGGDSHPIGGHMSWHHKGASHDTYLYLQDSVGDTLAIIRLVQSDGKSVAVHCAQGSHAKLVPMGTYSGTDLIGKLRELADELTGARVH
jgi:hypothetical protein